MKIAVILLSIIGLALAGYGVMHEKAQRQKRAQEALEAREAFAREQARLQALQLESDRRARALREVANTTQAGLDKIKSAVENIQEQARANQIALDAYQAERRRIANEKERMALEEENLRRLGFTEEEIKKQREAQP